MSGIEAMFFPIVVLIGFAFAYFLLSGFENYERKAFNERLHLTPDYATFREPRDGHIPESYCSCHPRYDAQSKMYYHKKPKGGDDENT